MDDLLKRYMPKEAPNETVETTTVSDPLFQKYLPNIQTPVKATATIEPSLTNKVTSGLERGVTNVIDTIGSGIGYVDEKLSPGGTERNQAFQSRIKKEREEYKAKFGDSIPAQIGEIGGEIAATAPFVPARVLQGISIGARALPTVLATGEKIAAPLINRIGALMGQGAVVGAEFNALTHSARPEKSLPVDMLEGFGTGAVAGPIAHGAVSATSKVLTGAKNLWANVQVSRLASETGIDPSAAKRIIGRLEEAGYTPTDAATALRQMGPKATLADLDSSLTTEASGLASFGGKPTSLLKGTFEDRAATANNSANQIIESKLGPKPDIQVEKDNIIQNARNLTSADYKTAHKSTQKMDAKSISDEIDDVLNFAVGREAAELQTAKGYLYRTNAQGNKVLKEDVRSLHKVRQALDDTLERLPKEGTSQKSSTYRSVDQVRKSVDAELKLVPEMKAADEKFAEKMQIKSGIDYGYQALTKGTKEEFQKIWNDAAANPEIQQKIMIGLRAAIGDAMEAAQRGELSGAQRLFGKKSVNREKLRTAFGNNADEVLDELAREASFRATENAVRSGSQTAERLAIQKAYGKGTFEGNSVIGDAAKGLAIDLATGAPGSAAGMMAVRNIGGGFRQRMLDVRAGNLEEGAADLLSRQGLMRVNALDALESIKKFSDRKITTTAKDIRSRLPVMSGAPLAEDLKEKFGKF